MVTRWVHPLAFHQYRWWKPARGGPAWFYGSPRRGLTRGSTTVDMETVDEPVRDIVRSVHALGWSTTGSCAGHFPSAAWCERAWSQLGRDAREIKGGGLVLRDVESGVERVLQDKTWRLVAREQFVRDNLRSSGHGALGVTGMGAAQRERILRAARERGVQTRLLGPDGLLFLVQGSDEAELSRGWDRVRSLIEGV